MYIAPSRPFKRDRVAKKTIFTTGTNEQFQNRAHRNLTRKTNIIYNVHRLVTTVLYNVLSLKY